LSRRKLFPSLSFRFYFPLVFLPAPAMPCFLLREKKKKDTGKHLHFNKMLLEVNRYRQVRNNIQLRLVLLHRAVIDLLHFVDSFMWA
jgi:hypothetical protein